MSDATRASVAIAAPALDHPHFCTLCNPAGVCHHGIAAGLLVHTVFTGPRHVQPTRTFVCAACVRRLALALQP